MMDALAAMLETLRDDATRAALALDLIAARTPVVFVRDIDGRREYYVRDPHRAEYPSLLLYVVRDDAGRVVRYGWGSPRASMHEVAMLLRREHQQLAAIADSVCAPA